MSPPPTEVHNRLKLFRQSRTITAESLANQIDVNRQTIGYIERGEHKVSLELALKIARELNVTVETLFSLTPFPDAFSPTPQPSTPPAPNDPAPITPITPETL